MYSSLKISFYLSELVHSKNQGNNVKRLWLPFHKSTHPMCSIAREKKEPEKKTKKKRIGRRRTLLYTLFARIPKFAFLSPDEFFPFHIAKVAIPA